MALKATMVQTQKVKVCKMYFGTLIINLLKVVLHGADDCVSNCISIMSITQKCNNYALM